MVKPAAKHSAVPAHATPLKKLMRAVGAAVGNSVHEVPFQAAAPVLMLALNPVWSPVAPTATQSEELGHVTCLRKSPVRDPDNDGLGTKLQELPFQRSIAVDSAKPAALVVEPTLQQLSAVVQVTPERYKPSGDWGDDTIDQLAPFHRSTRPLPLASAGKMGRNCVSCGLGPLHPTAQQAEAVVQLTALRPLWVCPVDGVLTIAHEEPFQRSRTAVLGLPIPSTLVPLAQHSVLPAQEMPRK
jgi:hypothetical protein